MMQQYPFSQNSAERCKHLNRMFDKYNQNLCEQQQFNHTYMDAELLYEQRSKSVIKRRDEIVRKKELETRLKVEAKYQKIDQIRQTRNQRLLSQNRSFI